MARTSLVIVSFIFLLIAYVVMQPEDESLRGAVDIIKVNPDVEAEFAPYKSLIGADYEGYKNHVYRVLTYTLHFLKGDKKHLPAIALALVYHDLGISRLLLITFLQNWQNQFPLRFQDNAAQC